MENTLYIEKLDNYHHIVYLSKNLCYTLYMFKMSFNDYYDVYFGNSEYEMLEMVIYYLSINNIKYNTTFPLGDSDIVDLEIHIKYITAM